jgi:hypothetical protein
MRASTLGLCWASRCPPDAMLFVLVRARGSWWSLAKLAACAGSDGGVRRECRKGARFECYLRRKCVHGRKELRWRLPSALVVNQ